MRVAWVTNLAAPYRLPVWQAVGRSVDLLVILLERALERDASANRGQEWVAESRVGYGQLTWGTTRLKAGEGRYYFATSSPLRLRADVMLLGGWESPAYWQFAAAASIRRTPVVGFYESHTLSARHRGGPLARARSFWFRRLDAVVVPGAASRDAVLSFGVDPTRIFTGFNAVDVNAISEAAGSSRTTADGHRFLYVGQFIERKNVAALIEAFRLIRHSRDSLTLVGSGPLASDLRKLVASYELDPWVEFAGYVSNDDLGTVLGGADTLILPSRAEVWGLVVNEALAAGLHVVVSEVAGVARSVHGMNGVWLTSPTVAAIADAMAASRTAFVGPIDSPEILQHTPEQLAAVFLEAFDFVVGERAMQRFTRKLRRDQRGAG